MVRARVKITSDVSVSICVTKIGAYCAQFVASIGSFARTDGFSVPIASSSSQGVEELWRSSVRRYLLLISI